MGGSRRGVDFLVGCFDFRFDSVSGWVRELFRSEQLDPNLLPFKMSTQEILQLASQRRDGHRKAVSGSIE